MTEATDTAQSDAATFHLSGCVTASASHAGEPAGAGTLVAALVESARLRPGQVAMRSKTRGLWRAQTWTTWHQGSADVLAALMSHGVRTGDRVAVVLGDEPDWFHAAMGIAGLGSTLVALPEAWSPEQVAGVMRTLNCAALMTGRADLLAMTSTPSLSRMVIAPPRAADGRPKDGPPLQPFAFSLLVPRPDCLMQQFTENELAQLLEFMKARLGPLAGTHAVIGCEAASAMGVAARLFLPLRGGVVPCLPEPGVDLLGTLIDVEPQVIAIDTKQWEALWHEAVSRREEATPLQQRLFDRAVNTTTHRPWTPTALLKASLRRHLGLRQCRLAAAYGKGLSPFAARSFSNLGMPVIQG